jgi:hypothetical protein
MRVNKSRELVVGGYVANGKNFDSIVVGFYEGDGLSMLRGCPMDLRLR